MRYPIFHLVFAVSLTTGISGVARAEGPGILERARQRIGAIQDSVGQRYNQVRQSISRAPQAVRDQMDRVGQRLKRVKTFVGDRKVQYLASKQMIRHFVDTSSKRGLPVSGRVMMQRFQSEGARGFLDMRTFPQVEGGMTEDGSYHLQMAVNRRSWTLLRRQPVRQSVRTISYDAQTGGSAIAVTHFNTDGSVRANRELTSMPDGSFRLLAQTQNRQGDEVTRIKEGSRIRKAGPFSLYRIDSTSSSSIPGVEKISTSYAVKAGSRIHDIPNFIGRRLDNSASTAR